MNNQIWIYVRRWITLVVLVFLACGCPANTWLLWKLNACSDKSTNNPYVIRSCDVEFDAKLLTSDPKSFIVPLPDGLPIHVKRLRDTVKIDGGIVWIGTVGGSLNSSATFSVVRGRFFGDIVMPNGLIYRLRMRKGQDSFYIEELDQKKLPKGSEPRGYEKEEPIKKTNWSGALAQVDCADKDSELDVLVVYTPAVLSAFEGAEDDLRAQVNSAVQETVTSYILSDIPLQINLKGVLPVQHIELGLGGDLDFVQSSSEVAGLRNGLSADIVVLITNNAPGGLANQFQSRHLNNLEFASEAFAVVPQVVLTGSYAFGHEIGHLLGAQHEAATYRGAFSNSKAYVNSEGNSSNGNECSIGWGTMMAVLSNCANCKVVQYWSNPDKKLCQVKLGGLDDDRNNANTLRRTAPTVTKFRCASPPRGPDA